MIRLFGAALLVAVSGCASGPATPQSQCEAAAYDDPVVKELMIKGTTTLSDQETLQNDKKRELKRATQQCLRAKGLAPPGGVEPTLPPR